MCPWDRCIVRACILHPGIHCPVAPSGSQDLRHEPLQHVEVLWHGIHTLYCDTTWRKCKLMPSCQCEDSKVHCSIFAFLPTHQLSFGTPPISTCKRELFGSGLECTRFVLGALCTRLRFGVCVCTTHPVSRYWREPGLVSFRRFYIKELTKKDLPTTGALLLQRTT